MTKQVKEPVTVKEAMSRTEKGLKRLAIAFGCNSCKWVYKDGRLVSMGLWRGIRPCLVLKAIVSSI